MKRTLKTLLLAVGITSPFVGPLAAQSTILHADIPFAFVVSNRTLPAGNYSVSQLKPASPVFALRGTNGHSLFVQLGRNEEGRPANPSLTFACYGKQCVLAKVTPAGGATAFALPQSAIEKSLTHKLGMASMISIKLAPR